MGYVSSFSIKIKVRGLPSRLLEYIPEDPVKSCYEVFIYRSSGRVYIFKIARIYLVEGALKTNFLSFSSQTEETNENTKH